MSPRPAYYRRSQSRDTFPPLNSINGYAQLLERQGPRARPEEAVRVIRRSAEHITTLLDGLLDISKIEDRVAESSIADTICASAISSTSWVDMFPAAGPRAKGIEFPLSPRGPTLAGLRPYRPQACWPDPDQSSVQRRFKYTERGHVAFSVRYRSDIAEFEGGRHWDR